MRKAKFGIFYNKQFDVLMINFNTNLDVTNVLNQPNRTIIKNEDEIIGINLFNVSKEIAIDNTFCSENPKVVKYVKDKIKDIYPVEQEVQFKIGKVLSSETIEGTHLHLCQVDLGTEVSQIVCGAKNMRTGLTVVAATPGTYMPNGMRIGEGKIRGNDSFGMICSARELGIKEGIYNDDGIIELDSSFDSKIGWSFWGEHNEQN